MKKKIITLFISFLLCISAINVFAVTTTLDLTNPSNPESFTFNDKNYWTETYNELDYTYWESQIFMFSHLIDGEGSSWGGAAWNGFTVSKNADNSNHGVGGSSEGWVSNQWGCMAGGGIESINEDNVVVSPERPYIIGFLNTYSMGGNSLSVLFNDGNLYTPESVYIANHPWPYYENIYGDGFAQPMSKNGDFFKLIAHGVAGDDTETTAELTLAEYKDGELKQSADWQKFDLSSLGLVKEIYFTMESWDVGDWGINTAVYFCMDKLSVSSAITGVDDNKPQHNDAYRVGSVLYNVPEKANIKVFDLSGRILYYVDANSEVVALPSFEGMKIIHVESVEGIQVIR